MQGGEPLVREGDLALSERFGATGAKIFIKVLIGKDEQ